MDRANWKKYRNKFFVLLMWIFVIYSIYVHLEYRNYVNQSNDRNDHILSIISFNGSNLADRLEEFVNLTNEEENSEVDSEVYGELYNNWRIVRSESRHIHSYLYAISTVHMGDEASDARGRFSCFFNSIQR